MLHYEFITNTDNKSLFNQIKSLVNCAQESFHRDLTKRREHLRELLDSEEKVYENEFVGKIKSRVDENIRERQESLLALKQKRTKELEKFVAEKRIQQNMKNCIVIRDELRKKDYRETKLCQLEQMDDRLRAIARESKEDEFWQKVQDRMAEDYDRRQHREEELKKDLQANQCRIWRGQVDEHIEAAKADWANNLKERRELDEKLKRYEAEQKAKERAKFVERYKDVRTSMVKICEQQKELAQEAENYEDVFHDETMRQVNLEMEEALHKNEGVKQAVHDYLNYLARFRQFVDEQEQQRDCLYEKLAENFHCYKKAPKMLMGRKKRMAAEQCHKVLLKQICEEMSRKAALEALEKENKIIENRFSRIQVKDKIKEREKIRSGLDLQIQEIHRVREEKEKQFKSVLNRAEEDKVFCEQVLERHKQEGLDYLTPHPNWKLMACYKNEGKCKTQSGGDVNK